MQKECSTSVRCLECSESQCAKCLSEMHDPSFLPVAHQDQICSDSIYFIMKLCNFLLGVVSIGNRNAVFCGTEAEAMMLLKINGGVCIYNSSCSEACAAVSSRFIRECNRVGNEVGCWNGGQFGSMVVESRGNKKKQKPSSPLSLSLPSIRSMATAASTTLPAIIFNFRPIGRRSVPKFEASCLFAGSLIDGRLMASFMQGLDLKADACQSFAAFIEAEQTVGIFDADEPYFAGFFLHESQFSSKLFEDLKQLFCKIAPVFVHLSQTCPARLSAEWWCCSEDSCAIKFVSQTPGWVVNFEGVEVSSCQSHAGFDVFFKPGSDSVTVVDPITLKELRLSRISGSCIDARKRELVPFCNTLLKDCQFQNRFPSLFTQDLVLVDQNVVWSFIDVGAREFVHVVALLSRAEYLQMNQKQKSLYLNALTWIFSRTGAAPASKYNVSGNVFAVGTACCFMLNQMTEIRSVDVPPGLKQFYVPAKGAASASAEVPDRKLLTSLIEKYRSAPFINAQGGREAYEIPDGCAKMMFSQMYDPNLLHKVRCSLQILPTLEFHNNSCWMETAVNALFAIPFVRVKLFSFQYTTVVSNEACKCLRSLYDIMCTYGPSEFNRVPFVECQRCGVYPIEDDTAPPVLGSEGYTDIFHPEEQKWGSLGSASQTLLRFCSVLELQVLEVGYDPEATISSCHKTAIVSGFNSDVLLVNVDKEHDLQPSSIHEVIQDGFCCAVLFGNGAHHFSVCKAMIGECWTVKDNIVQEYSTFPTFADALSRAYGLHAKSHCYFVHTLVYHRDYSIGDNA